MNALLKLDAAMLTMSSLEISFRKIGHVYVIEATDGLSVKIGRSRRPNKRMQALKTQSNAGGRCFVSPLQSDCFHLELACHEAHKSQRQLGEWFSVGFDEAVKNVKSMLQESPTFEVVQHARAKQKNDGKKFFDGARKHFYRGEDALANAEHIQMREAFKKAKLMRDVIVLHHDSVRAELESVEKFGGISEFELVAGILIATSDREEVARLMHESYAASFDDALFCRLIQSLRDHAAEEAKAAGVAA